MEKIQCALFAALCFILSGCVPNTAFRTKQPTFNFNFERTETDEYYFTAKAGLAFVEFDKNGKLFNPREVTAALGMIDHYNAQDPKQGALVVVFVHGWKNNTSDAWGNIWAFRRSLDEIAYLADGRPTMGVYIGWPGVGFPGQDPGFLENVSFSDRESVANKVGEGDLRNVLRQIMSRTKAKDRHDHSSLNARADSSCVLIGHSFGGLVLEKAVTPILQEAVEKSKGTEVSSPVDLVVLINEAAPAGQAVSFLKLLLHHRVTYKDKDGHDHPLLLSITSSGDVATKFAFPGGQFLSPHRPANSKRDPDEFGIDSDLTYWLLTTANTLALQNHKFDSRLRTEPPAENAYLSVNVGRKMAYDFLKITPAPRNVTPYWVSQLPQVFVPDHGTVFGCNFMYLLMSFLEKGQVIHSDAMNKSAGLPSCQGGSQPTLISQQGLSPTGTRVDVWLHSH